MKRAKKIKEALRKGWGVPKEGYFHFGLIGDYFEGKRALDEEVLITDKTAFDLDFQEFFKFVDRTTSYVGQQYLYDQLRKGNPSTAYFEQLESNIQFFNDDETRRIQAQLQLKELSEDNDYYFPFLIFGELPPKLSFIQFIYVLQYITIGGCIAAFFFPALIIPLIFMFAINLFLHYWHKKRIGNFGVIFSRISRLVKMTKQLMPITNMDQVEETELRQCLNRVEKTTSKILLLKMDSLKDGDIGQFAWFLIEQLKVLTLSEITTFNKLLEEIRIVRKDIQYLFEWIGNVDMAISIASLREGLPYYSHPIFSKPQKAITLQSLYHPLVKNCVENDLHLYNKSLLLTGSNMSGKSTFIKAVNLNIIASQVLHTSFTTSYEAPIFHIATSIRIQDDLMADTSYYRAEVESIGHLMELSEQADRQYLFTIDEVFKGTNTIERISAAKSILSYLTSNKNHLVLVSTHDIELTQLLEDQYELHYFQETIDNELLSFDYKLRKGALQKRNAINILELAGYPSEVIEEARELSVQFEQEKVNFGTQ